MAEASTQTVFVHLGNGNNYRLSQIRVELALALGKLDEGTKLNGKNEAAIRNALHLLNEIDAGCFLRHECTIMDHD